MFAAQIRNKLTRSEEDMEDLLTSNVFGIWRYMPPQVGLLQFLQTAKRLDKVSPFRLNSIVTADLQFWPWLQEGDDKGAEPDVLIEMSTYDQQKWLVLIESKYLSGKSSLPTSKKESLQPTDQLAREMYNLRRKAQRESFTEYALIYVTAHTIMPKSDIQEAIDELTEKTGDGSADHFYWTTWRILPKVFTEVMGTCEKVNATILADLCLIIKQLGLLFFEGITSNGWNFGEPAWLFEHSQEIFNWSEINMGYYTFESTTTKFDWATGLWPNKILWRFSTWQKKRKGN